MTKRPEGHIILTPESKECPGCGEEFTDEERRLTS